MPLIALIVGVSILLMNEREYLKEGIKITREEAIELFFKQLTAARVVLDSGFGSNPGENDILYRRRKEMAEIALTALSTLQSENKKLRAEMSQARESLDFARTKDAEILRLGMELGHLKKHMERLTHRLGNGELTCNMARDDCRKMGGDCQIDSKILDRLAAYEETELAPEDFKRAFTEDALLKLTGQLLGVTPDRLRELAQADREGKISKYTIGDAIYDRFGDAWEVRTAELHLLGEKPDWMYRCGHAGTDDYCALWSFEILTHEEAAISALRPISRECGNKAAKKIVQEVLKND